MTKQRKIIDIIKTLKRAPPDHDNDLFLPINIDEDPNTFTYTLYNIEDLERNFNVTKLSTYNKENCYYITWDDIRDIIKRAIDVGELKIDERGLKEETIKKLKGEEQYVKKPKNR